MDICNGWTSLTTRCQVTQPLIMVGGRTPMCERHVGNVCRVTVRDKFPAKTMYRCCRPLEPVAVLCNIHRAVFRPGIPSHLLSSVRCTGNVLDDRDGGDPRQVKCGVFLTVIELQRCAENLSMALCGEHFHHRCRECSKLACGYDSRRCLLHYKLWRLSNA